MDVTKLTTGEINLIHDIHNQIITKIRKAKKHQVQFGKYKYPSHDLTLTLTLANLNQITFLIAIIWFKHILQILKI